MATGILLTPNDTVHLIEAMPFKFSHFHLSWHSGQGGGTAVIHRNSFKCSFLSFGSFNSFEVLSFF